MESRKRVVKEYREILNSLASLRQSKKLAAVLQQLETGWLTPGSEILQRIEKKKLHPAGVLAQPDSLHRKWFEDLSHLQKGRWVNIFRDYCSDERLQNILQLTLRRLQQLQKLTQPPRQPATAVQKPRKPKLIKLPRLARLLQSTTPLPRIYSIFEVLKKTARRLTSTRDRTLAGPSPIR